MHTPRPFRLPRNSFARNRRNLSCLFSESLNHGSLNFTFPPIVFRRVAYCLSYRPSDRGCHELTVAKLTCDKILLAKYYVIHVIHRDPIPFLLSLEPTSTPPKFDSFLLHKKEDSPDCFLFSYKKYLIPWQHGKGYCWSANNLQAILTFGIVGGGLSGLSAAHTVLQAGGNVLVLDKNPFFGMCSSAYLTAC
jgi:hypothetical protein